METAITGYIMLGIGIAGSVFSVWKSGWSVNKELNKKLDKTEHDKDISEIKSTYNKELSCIKSSLENKLEEDDLKSMRENILGAVDRTNEIAQLELKFLKADLKKHEMDHTTLNKSIKDIEVSFNSMSVSMAVLASQMKYLNDNKITAQ
jgi:septal ring factor EnvC (AmiA/AmiB activator)